MTGRITKIFIALFIAGAPWLGEAQDAEVTFEDVIEGIKWLPSQTNPNLDSLWDLANRYFEQANDTAISEIYYQFGDYYFMAYKYDSAKALLNESIRFSRIANDSSDLAAGLILYGHVCYDVENIGEAIESYHEALAIYDDIGMKDNAANAYNSIGNAYSYIVDYNSSLLNYQKGIALYREINDSVGLAMIYSNLAGQYIEQKKYDLADQAYDSSYAYSDKGMSAKMDLKIGEGVIFQERKQYKMAEKSFRNAMSYALEIQDDIQLGFIYQNLAFLFLAEDMLDSAARYLKLAELQQEKYDIKSLGAGISELKHEYYFKIGEYKLAYELLEKARNESDSFYDIDMTRQLQEVQAQYSTLRSEKEIAQKDLELQMASNEIEKNKLIRNTLIALIVLVIIVVVVVLRSQRLKAESNKMLRQKNSQIEEINKEIKNLEEAKTKWFINIAHELRTPLTLIKGPVRHALTTMPPDSQVFDHLRIADRNVARLQKLVDEILDISKMEAGKMPLNLKNVNLTELALNVIASFDSAAREVKVKMEMAFDPKEEFQARVDEEKVTNVLINLISNALKFTHEGGSITVGLTHQHETVRLSVTDTGEGIPEEDLDKVFNRFYQASNSSGLQGGTGVGLAFCKEIAKMHKGDLTVKSVFGEGSTFELEVPYIPPLESSMPDLDQPMETIPEMQGEVSKRLDNPLLKNKKILIVDDNADMRNYIGNFLSDSFVIKEARDGLEALDILKKETPDLIISDVMMPRMDGVEFAREVKEHDNWKFIPFITVSAIGDNHDKVNTLRIGIDDYMVKPFFGEELLVRVQNLFQNYSMRSETKEQEEERELSHEEKLLQKLEEEVFKNIEDPNFNVQRLAEIAAMSERQLYRYLKQMTGLTPASYVREIRLQRAMELIQKRVYSRTSQLSYAVGFQQPSYFSTVFKKRFGRLPADYIEG